MLIALFGSTGRVGGRFLEYALAEGHGIRALVRDPSKLEPRANLETVVGDVLDPKAVERSIRGVDAVVSGLGGAGVDNPGDAQSQGMRNIVAAMQKLGVRRVLGVAGSGILESIHGGLRHDQPGFPPLFRTISGKHQEAWEAMRDSGLDWTMVATGDILPGERTRNYRTIDNFLPKGATHISVEDVADFLLRELHEGKHIKTRVGAGY